MGNWENLRPYLPSVWIAALESLPLNEQQTIQELRLRKGQPLVVSFPSGDRFLCPSRLTTLQQSDVLICRAEQLESCFLRFCEDSVYAHEQELRQGFIAVRGGIRVGVAATAVLDGDNVRCIRQVTSLCVRLPRRHLGCACSLMPYIYDNGRVRSTLLVGEPSSGKTSLLRDIACSLAARGVRVAVADERGELAGLQGLDGCDVLCGYPKSVGILQAVRCLAPQVVMFDELGTVEEIDAVLGCAHAGVVTIASVHGNSPDEMANKSVVRAMVEQEVFSQWVFLRGRYAPSEWRACLCPEVVDDEILWHPVDRCDGVGNGLIVRPTIAVARGVSESSRTVVGGVK